MEADSVQGETSQGGNLVRRGKARAGGRRNGSPFLGSGTTPTATSKRAAPIRSLTEEAGTVNVVRRCYAARALSGGSSPPRRGRAPGWPL